MLSVEELTKIYKSRLKDAGVLFDKGRWDGAIYLCGYALEIKLKLRICRTLKWQSFPQTRKEFENFQSLKTHNYETLLSLSGQELKVKTNYLPDWSIALGWNPELRYTTGKANRKAADDMLNSTKKLIKALK